MQTNEQTDTKSNKMLKRKGNLVIFVFPYLFLDKEWDLGDYKLKPSYTSLVSKESGRLRGHLDKIARSFRLRNTNLINQYTYGWATIHDKKEWDGLKSFLDNISTILRYQELSDEKSGANYSNFDYVVFEIYRPMSRYKISFYEGVLNGKNRIPIHYPETKFCPNLDMRPYVYITESKGQALSHLIYMTGAFHSTDEEKRILRALDWFNKSFKPDPEIDDAERFMNLAIAFEALFDSPEEKILSSLKTGISSLLGETKEMIHWLSDFYDQRSRIVHGKDQVTTLYKARQGNQPHLDHIRFARKVFTRCVKAILTAREDVYTQDLHKELISNEVRMKEIQKVLISKKTLKEVYETKIFDVIDSLTQKDLTGKASDVIEIGRKLLPMVKNLLKIEKRQDLLKQLNDIISYSGNDLPKLGIMYNDFHTGFTPLYFNDKTISIKEIPLLALKGAVYNFTSYATWRLMTF